MDIRRLKHLVALADERNFGRAAQQCHLTQSAFSRSIMAAEEEFGLLLFNRGTVEATCTDAGAFVVEKARKLLFGARCHRRPGRVEPDVATRPRHACQNVPLDGGVG